MEEMTHYGKIVAINADILTVAFEQNAACGSCEARSHCALHKSETHKIEIQTSAASEYVLGQTVELEMSFKAGLNAVLYAYIFPLILMLTSLFLTWFLTKDEILSATISLTVLFPYYLLLFIFRHKINAKMQIRIR